jgi:hypothetical protein
VESALRLDRPLRLDALGLMLGVIRVEFASYKLTEVSFNSLSPVGGLTYVRYRYNTRCRRIAGP